MDDLDKLLGFTKPISEYTDEELVRALKPHLQATRPQAKNVDELMNDPMFKGDAMMEKIIKEHKMQSGNFSFKL